MDSAALLREQLDALNGGISHAMVTGASLFGAAGVFALPIALAVIKQLDDDGIIHVIKKPNQAEEKTQAPGAKPE